jgi:hypothetical protein
MRLWGLYPSLKPLQWLIIGAGAVGAVVALRLPRERTLLRVAAAGGTLLLVAELTSNYWYYFYILWFLPYALIAFIGLPPAQGSGVPVAVADRTLRSFSRKK